MGKSRLVIFLMLGAVTVRHLFTGNDGLRREMKVGAISEQQRINSNNPATPRDNRIYDIEIGVAGVITKSTAADVLVTFDPGDTLKITDEMESYPFAIADFDGTASFWVNDDYNDCGSLNYIHGLEVVGDNNAQQIKQWYMDWQGSACRNAAEKRRHLHFAFLCMFPQKSHFAPNIPVKRLSTFLRESGIQTIHHLQIDAQGADFAILKDVFENYAGNVSIQRITVECQYYNTSRPLYLAANDCQQIKNYVQGKCGEGTMIQDQLNNCGIMEYNLKINLQHSSCGGLLANDKV